MTVSLVTNFLLTGPQLKALGEEVREMKAELNAELRDIKDVKADVRELKRCQQEQGKTRQGAK